MTLQNRSKWASSVLQTIGFAAGAAARARRAYVIKPIDGRLVRAYLGPMTTLTRFLRSVMLTLAALACPDLAPAQSTSTEAAPAFLADRGPGVPTSNTAKSLK